MLEQTIETTEKAVDEDGLFLRIWERVREVVNPSRQDAAFSVQKDLNGEYRWIATFTNNFKDRDGEIISEKALDGYLERVNAGFVPMPELWLGHIEGTKHGQADMVFGIGNFVTAIGHFDSPEIGKQAANYTSKYGAKTPLSHGFTFPNWGLKQGIYEVVNTFEISVLPPPLVASNPFTEFEVNDMKQITPDQEAAGVLYFGKEKWEQLKTNRLQQSEEIKAAGVAFKDFVELKEDAPAADAPEGEKPAAETVNPAMADLMVSLIESQGELLTLLGAQGKALKATQDAQAAKDAEVAKQIEGLQSLAEKLQAELKLTPRAASTAPETKLSETEAAAVKQELAQAEADPFWKA